MRSQVLRSQILTTSLLIFALLVACQGAAGVGAEEAEEEEGKVLGEMEGYRLTEGEFSRLMSLLPDDLVDKLSDAGERSKFIRTWMQTRALMKAAEDQGMGDESDFQRRLEIRRMQMLADYFLERATRDAKPSEDTLRSFYEANKNSYRHPVTVELRRILVAKRSMAREIVKKARAGEDFEALALEHSKDLRTKHLKGYVGWVTPMQMPAALDQVVFGLEPGAISDPVQTVEGWFVLQAIKKKPAGHFTFEEIRPTLEAQLTEQEIKRVRDETVQAALDRYRVRFPAPEPQE